MLLARLDQEKAHQSVRKARAPFSPQLTLGSGLAYTSGIPQSVEGSTPSIVRAVGRQFLYNRSQSNRVKEARELETAAGHSAAGKRNEVAFRVASTYLDFESAWRRTKLLADQAENLRRIEGVIAARVGEGRQLPLELTRARLETARARQQLEAGKAQVKLLEATLKHELNLPQDASLEPQPSGLVSTLPLPLNETEAQGQAVASNPELKRIEASLRAKGFSLRAEKGALVPRIDLVAEEMSLRDLRRAHELTQERLAEFLGIGQEGVSRLEKRADLLLSTLRGYVEAMGGRLRLVADFPDRPPVVLSGLAEMESPDPQRRPDRQKR